MSDAVGFLSRTKTATGRLKACALCGRREPKMNKCAVCKELGKKFRYCGRTCQQ